MQPMLVTLSVKNRDPLINYHMTPNITILRENIIIENVNFHIPTLLKEVKQTKKKELLKYKRLIKTFLATASTFMLLPLKSMASTSLPVNTNLPKSAEGIPPELMELLIMLLVISVGSAVILAAICLVGAGVMKMFRKKKEADAWTVDILKGLIQILTAVPIVFLIYYVANTLFAGSGWFVSPF